MEAPGTIEVRRDGEGYRVVLMPPDPTHSDQCFDDFKTACGHAGGLRLVTGRRKVDFTDG